MIALRWTGMNEAAALLRRLPRLIAEELLAKAVLAGADLIAIEAQGRIPRPGLRRRAGTKRLSDSVRVELQSKDRAHARVAIGTKSPYGHLVEYGHQIVARGPGRKALGDIESIAKTYSRTGKGRVGTSTLTHEQAIKRMRADLRSQLTLRRSKGPIGFVAARPFLRPAFDEQRERALQRMAAVIRAGVEQWVAQQPVVRRAA